jgi:hypothetical protein
MLPRPRTLILASFLLAALVPIFNDAPHADLSRWYTDHLHNSHATWVFLHRGLAVYTEPFGEASRGIEYPHLSGQWAQMPIAYPPGVFAVFLVPSLLGKVLPLSTHAFSVLLMLYLLALAHLALFAVWRALEPLAPGGRLLVGAFAWMFLLRLGWQGFYDSAWIACGAMAVRALHDGKPRTSLRWLAAAGLLHFRAAVLLPVGIAALVAAIRGKPARGWPWKDLGAVAVAGAVAVTAFVLMVPLTGSVQAEHGSLLTLPSLRTAIVAAATVVAAALAWRWAGPIAAGTALVSGALALVDYEPFWWHGTILLFVPLVVGVWRAAAAPSAARAVLCAYVLCVQPLAWKGTPGDVWVELAEHFRLPR